MHVRDSHAVKRRLRCYRAPAADRDENGNEKEKRHDERSSRSSWRRYISVVVQLSFRQWHCGRTYVGGGGGGGGGTVGMQENGCLFDKRGGAHAWPVGRSEEEEKNDGTIIMHEIIRRSPSVDHDFCFGLDGGRRPLNACLAGPTRINVVNVRRGSKDKGTESFPLKAVPVCLPSRFLCGCRARLQSLKQTIEPTRAVHKQRERRRISGAAFSPFPNQDDAMYVKCMYLRYIRP